MNAMIGRLLGLALVLATGFAFGQGDVKHEEVLQKLLGSLQGITKTLEGVTDEATAQSARPELKKQAEEFRTTRKQSEAVPPPTPEARDRIAKEYQPKFVTARKELLAQTARVQRVPGGTAALQEIRGVFEKGRE